MSRPVQRRIAIVGAEGQLGHDLASEMPGVILPLTHDRLPIENEKACLEVMTSLNPDVIVNTAAYHHVDRCEESPEKAFSINAVGAGNLARAAAQCDAVLIHFSTDYVFDGYRSQPYVETSPARPLNVYGVSKLAGEHMIMNSCEKYFILRTSGLYGQAPCRAKGLNFPDLMVKLGRERQEVRVVDSEILTPTSTLELARQTAALIDSDRWGVYHATAEGACSWYEFASEIFRLMELPAKLNIAAPDEFPAKTPRPSYSVLENAALKNSGLNSFRHWKTGLKEYLEMKWGKGL